MDRMSTADKTFADNLVKHNGYYNGDVNNDIREIINSLDDQDKTMFNQHRTEMRRSYLPAHNSIIGVHAWDAYDDAFMDIIDLKLAILFDRAGRFEAVKDKTIDDAMIERVENDIIDAYKGIKQHEVSKATASMQGNGIANEQGWTSKP